MPSAKRKSAEKKPSSKKGSPVKATKATAKASPTKAAPKHVGSPKKISKNTVSPDFLASLITTKCSELKLPSLFTAKKEDRIADVWGKLISKMIMAAPVVDDQNEFQGFIDTSDIASYLVAKFGDPMLRTNLGETDGLNAAMSKELKNWMNKTVGDVMAFDYPTKLRCPPVCYANHSLLSAIEPLAMTPGLHRVVVVESPTSNRLVSVITQSQALSHIYDNVGHLGSRKTKPIEDCVDVVKPAGIFVVTKDHIALDAFQHMLKNGVSALAVVSEPKGKIRGVVSLRDLQAIGADGVDLWKLYIGIDSFLKFKAIARAVAMVDLQMSNQDGKTETKSAIEPAEASEGKEEKTAEPEPPKKTTGSKKVPSADIVLESNLKCSKGDTFASAIKGLTQNGVHRLFLTDEDDVPFGVVSIKEVLKEIIH